MIKQIIAAGDYQRRAVFKKDGDNYLNVSEFYYDTIQGEGINIGYPSAVLRLQGCSLNCSYCDTTEVWRYGSPYTFTEIFDLMSDKDIIHQLRNGQHLVFTGGSPLLQQDKIYKFIDLFVDTFSFMPFIEIENEAVIMPTRPGLIDCWNNSPKLSSSGVPFETRYKPDVIYFLSQLPDSWFKFVIMNENDWNEIDINFLMPGLIRRDQIILMPEGGTRAELEKNREVVVELAVKQGVRYCSREHIILWDKKVGA